MEKEKFSISKLLKGTFNIFSGQVIGKWLNIILILAVLGTVGGVIYKLFIKDTIGEQQTMESQTIRIEQPQVEHLYTGQVQHKEDKGGLAVGGFLGGINLGGDAGAFGGVKVDYQF